MANYLYLLLNPQFRFHRYFEVLRDFRKGGLTPENYEAFIADCDSLPKNIADKEKGLAGIRAKYRLTDITEDDFAAVMRGLQKRSVATAKKCWHPESSIEDCNTDGNGNVIISAAHSIQNNGILKRIANNGHVKGYVMEDGEFDGKLVGKNVASTFYGFCNKHDAMFRPIELEPYTGTAEQKFLFAYRAFVVAMHAKEVTSYFMNFGEQAMNDIVSNKMIFDSIITHSTYERVVTHEFRLNAFYPIAAASSFYLEVDFEAAEIPHSPERMEYVYVTLYPLEKETVFLLSYFKDDEHLYKKLGDQILKRENLKSDISILLAPHVENIFFEPVYFDTFITQQNSVLHEAFRQAQLQVVRIVDDNKMTDEVSLTPKKFLENDLKLNLFGY